MADYTKEAQKPTPALVIYLIDASGSMADPFGKARRIDHVDHCLKVVLLQLVQRSTKGALISPRYHVSLISYADEAQTEFPTGLLTIDKLAQLGAPEFVADGYTNTADAFRLALDLLKRELPSRMNDPAPLVCHLTDGEYTGDDPEPYAREIMKLRNRDGAVLVENIFIGDGLTEPNVTAENWGGIVAEDELDDPYLRKLFRMSSILPASIRKAVDDEVSNLLRPGARMFFPASVPDLVELAFTVSSNTGVAAAKGARR